MSKTKTILDFVILSPFDRYEGDRRTDVKCYDKEEEYRGFKILRNGYIPNGADGRWEVPELNYIYLGGINKGFLTVSKLQCIEAIDRWFDLNEKIRNIDEYNTVD